MKEKIKCKHRKKKLLHEAKERVGGFIPERWQCEECGKVFTTEELNHLKAIELGRRTFLIVSIALAVSILQLLILCLNKS